MLTDEILGWIGVLFIVSPLVIMATALFYEIFLKTTPADYSACVSSFVGTPPAAPIISDNVTIVLRGKMRNNVLQLLKIKGLMFVETGNLKLDVILNRHLPLGNTMDCQIELIEAGFEDIAKL